MIFSCPGSDRFKHPQAELIKCPNCGDEVEIWTDEVEAACPSCKKKVFRAGDQGCLGWCKYAKECVGEETFNKYMENRKGGR